MPHISRKAEAFTESVIRDMTRLAMRHGAVNLAQGFPDFEAPDEIKAAACEAIRGDINQYAITWGAKAFRDAIVAKTARWYPGWEVDPETELTVTCGATEGMIAAMLAILDPGDEIVVFEPFYENYGPDAILSGAVPRYVTLHEPDWRFDPDELRAAFGPRTRGIVVNSPHNPTGRVFDVDELDQIAAVAIDHDLWVITDEVYEHLVFPGATHVPLATRPGMAERTLTISSGGKTFNTTGWKVGWMCGPGALVQAARTAKQFLTYVNAGPFQPAIAVGLELGDDFYADLAVDLTAKRDRLVAGLRAAELTTFVPEATYFATVDIRSVEPDGDGLSFCRALPARCGVVAIPSQVMYLDPAEGRSFVRLLPYLAHVGPAVWRWWRAAPARAAGSVAAGGQATESTPA